MAVRKLFILLLFACITSFAQTTEELLIFTEAGSGLHLEKRFAEKSERELFTTISTELQTPVSRLAIDGSVYLFASLDSLSKWQTGVIYERTLPLFSFSISGRCLDDEKDSLDVRHITAQFFDQYESSTAFSEYGLRGRNSSFPGNDAFSNLEFNAYFLTKKFLETYNVHHEFNAATKHFADNSPLLMVNYQITFSFPVGDYSGLNLSYFLNHNLYKGNQLLYPSEELYDLFSYNMHKFSIEYSMEKGNLLGKPWLALTSKDYLSTAVEWPYFEISLLAGFYADWLWADGCMTYAKGFYQTTDVDDEIAFEFIAGLKFQFDILTR
jgi:hypothetical protein